MIDAARNLSSKALRRLLGIHKPVVRLLRHRARLQEKADRVDAARQVEREIAAVGASGGHILVGPWLGEVGYEALYWVPFLRWFRDAFRITPDRLTVVSRGGVESWYRGMAARYVDLFDHFTAGELASANAERQLSEEGGGRKQSARGALDERILSRIDRSGSLRNVAVLHPSLMFRLFRDVWHGGLPYELLWDRTRYVLMDRPERPDFASLPRDYIAIKFYTGTALPGTPQNRATLRALVRQIAALGPVIDLETGRSVDDHEDYAFFDIPNVISARTLMTPRENLGVQTAVIAHARCFISTCGGLAWLAPFLGVPTVAVYADDRQLAPHLLTSRQAVRRTGGAEFSLIDLRALSRVGGSELFSQGPFLVGSRVEGDSGS